MKDLCLIVMGTSTFLSSLFLVFIPMVFDPCKTLFDLFSFLHVPMQASQTLSMHLSHPCQWKVPKFFLTLLLIPSPQLVRDRLVGTNAAFLVPDHIQNKFAAGWNVHVPLAYLMEKGCHLQDKPFTNTSHEVLTIDNSMGHILASSKPLSNEGELDLTFNEWHQVWWHLLDLIKVHLPDEFLMWEVHYSFILNNHNHAEMWPLYLAYDAKICKRAVQLLIDPSRTLLFSTSTQKVVLSLIMSSHLLSLTTISTLPPTDQDLQLIVTELSCLLIINNIRKKSNLL